MRTPTHAPMLLVASFLLACGTSPPEAAAPEAEAAVPATVTRCFLSVTASGDGTLQDTMAITLRFTNGDVEGRMDWKPQEKDHMRGTLKGRVEGDRLTALYDYSAEGERATEERVFLLASDRITMLSGEMEERNGVWVLADPDAAVEGMTVPEVACP